MDKGFVFWAGSGLKAGRRDAGRNSRDELLAGTLSRVPPPGFQARAGESETEDFGSAHGFVLACPTCGTLLAVDRDAAICPACDTRYGRADGIWDFLPAGRAAAFAPFLEAYRTVRAAEGWGADTPRYYAGLPNAPANDPLRPIWLARAEAFHALERDVLAPRETTRGRTVTVLDLGAGNCWLAHRLADRGHRVAAVDLSTSKADGLGAWVHYPAAVPDAPPAGGPGDHIVSDPSPSVGFETIRAEFDRLPFAGGQVDLVVFNAALHYADRYEVTLGEALRVLRPDGAIVVLDTPVYRDAASGRSMLVERERRHHARHGIAPSTHRAEGFLTWDRVDQLRRELDLEVRVIWPVAAWRRLLRRAKAHLASPREPASFPLLVLRRSSSTDGAVDVSSRGTNRGIAVTGALFAAPWPGGSGLKARAPGATPTHSIDEAPGKVPALIPSPCGTKIAASARTTATRARRAAGRLAVRVGYLLFGRHRHRRLAVERIGPWTVVVFPDVFNPKLFRTGEVLALTLDEVLVPPGSAVLDLGTGSGIGAIAAARFTPRVSAVDLSPEAIRCARVNCAVNRVEDRVDLRQGDLFTPVGGERFDVVLFNPPFFRGIPKDLFDRSWRSPDVAERFAAGLADHLTPDGHALVVLSSDGDPAGFLRALRANAFAVDVVARREFLNETLTIYRARAGRWGRCA